MAKNNLLLNQDNIIKILSDDKIVLVDGGARGELFKPFNLVNPAIVFSLRFDPDPDCEIIKSDNHLVISKALWKDNSTIQLHVAKEPSASSIFPPNNQILKQIDPNYELRQTAKKISVAATTIDDACKENNISYPDFIKLDIHGSEYEALEGASESLKENTIALLVESWSLPIHKGQKTRAAVELLLNDHEIYLLEEYELCKWKRNVSNSNFKKVQSVGYDSLLFKDVISQDKKISLTKAIKYIGIADLFGHYGYALQLNEYFLEKGILEQSLSSFISQHINSKKKENAIHKYCQKVISILERKLYSFA